MYFRRIEDLRIDNDKTKKDLAEMLICNRQVYSRYERGLREIPVSMVLKLAEYYNVSVDYLLGVTNEKTPFRREGKK